MDNTNEIKTEAVIEVEDRTALRCAVTLINPELDAERTVAVKAGEILCEKYEVVAKLDATTGEADLYICKSGETNYVAKIYRRAAAVMPELANRLKKIDSPNIARLIETGLYRGLPVEISEYYSGGSLSGKRFTFEGLKQFVIPGINRGLKALHAAGIIHKDLKPSNIMTADGGKRVAIIDFGVSALHGEGLTAIGAGGMTPEYSAPEVFSGLFLEESDYYSFGIVLYELFCGQTPYKGMSTDEIARYTAAQKIPLPPDMPKELRELIAALTYGDITNRNNKNNPNRRWGYAEVDRWLKGVPQTLPGVDASSGQMPSYSFNGNEYSTPATLTAALAESWNDGKKQLFGGKLSAFFKKTNPAAARLCVAAEDEAVRQNGKDDLIFWRWIYTFAPEIKSFYWRGKKFESISALGREMLENLWKKNTAEYGYYEGILSEGVLSEFAALVAPGNADLKEASRNIEMSLQVDGADARSREIACYLAAYLLSGQKVFLFDGKQFRTARELADYVKGLLDKSYDDFEAFCHKTIGYDDVLDAQFESWLIATGKSAELELWRRSLN